MRNSILPVVTDLVRDAARPLTGSSADYDNLLEFAGDAHFVLLGEASHGTHEFYRERAQITKRLIREKGFTAIAVEADWPDAYRVNHYVQGQNVDAAIWKGYCPGRRSSAICKRERSCKP
jgi:erythromycin esterase-like protein